MPRPRARLHSKASFSHIRLLEIAIFSPCLELMEKPPVSAKSFGSAEPAELPGRSKYSVDQ